MDNVKEKKLLLAVFYLFIGVYVLVDALSLSGKGRHYNEATCEFSYKPALFYDYAYEPAGAAYAGKDPDNLRIKVKRMSGQEEPEQYKF